MKVNHVELAQFCQEEFKASFNANKHAKYCDTQFVAIMEDNSILTSSTPHILVNANKSILIHHYSERAVTNSYSWYKIQFINERGEVLTEALDDEFKLRVDYAQHFHTQQMQLEGNRSYMYYYFKSVAYPGTNAWGEIIKDFWELYVRLKATSLASERELIASLFKKDKKILELEKEVENFKFTTHLLKEKEKQYEALLGRIKELVEKQ